VVWRNELGGLTFEVGEPERAFVKWAPAGSGLDLAAEAARMTWASAYAAVPRVLGQGSGAEGAWLVTTPVAGESAVSERWKAAPAAAVVAIGEGLRALHDALPVEACPYSWSVEERLDVAHRRARAGRQDPARRHPVHQGLSVAEALSVLDVPPVVDAPVVCHGDACAPNTLVGDDGRWSGHVDLGTLGVADRWADLAIATWSTQWNYGPGWEARLLDAYGIGPDPARTRYYRLLWDFT
jgi:kanamycin kinase